MSAATQLNNTLAVPIEEAAQAPDGAAWAYAGVAGGIVSSTAAVTMKAAATVTRQGATIGLRNYLTGMQIYTDTLSVATEITVVDAAGPTVVWRGKLQTTNQPQSILFPNGAVKSSPNAALQVQLGTSATGGVYVSAQGYTGA